MHVRIRVVRRYDGENFIFRGVTREIGTEGFDARFTARFLLGTHVRFTVLSSAHQDDREPGDLPSRLLHSRNLLANLLANSLRDGFAIDDGGVRARGLGGAGHGADGTGAAAQEHGR